MDESGHSVPIVLPEIHTGMDPNRIYDGDPELDPKYISFAPGKGLRRNYLRREGNGGKQLMGNYFKGLMKNRQPFSLLGFAQQ